MISVQILRRTLRGISFCPFRVLSMASEKLGSISEVEIDPEGTFKYILIKVYSEPKSSAAEPAKTIVRGFKSGAFHGDIYDATLEKLKVLGLDSECLGGGRIKHDPGAKKLLVYGYSQGFGKADHDVTVGLLKKKYPEYDVTASDEGY